MVTRERGAFLKEHLKPYFSTVFNESVEIVRVDEIGSRIDEFEGEPSKAEFKGFGYGIPYLISLKIGNRLRKVVLETLRTTGGFGHDYRSDRAGILMWQNSFGKVVKKEIPFSEISSHLLYYHQNSFQHFEMNLLNIYCRHYIR